MEPLVAVVILNWNGVAYLEKFLPSVMQSKYANLKVVVGDNASSDHSVDYVRMHFPSVEIIVNDENYGFAEGYNKILERVTADYYVLLNSDVEVTENWIKPVIDLMESDPAVAVAQPKIRAYHNKDSFEYAGAAGGFIDKYGYPFCRGRIFEVTETDSGQYEQPTEIFWASGAAFFIKSCCWKESGGLDAELFAHMEEIDLCWRLKNAGYKIAYCPDATVFHVGGGTLDAASPHKTYLNFRNNLLIIQKNTVKGQAARLLTVRFMLDFLAWLKFMASGKPKFSMAISKAHIYFLRNRGRNGKKRKADVVHMAQHTGVYNKSIVYMYFAKKISRFSLLPGIEKIVKPL